MLMMLLQIHNIVTHCRKFKNEQSNKIYFFFLFLLIYHLWQHNLFNVSYIRILNNKRLFHLIEVILQTGKFIIMKRTYSQCDLFLFGAI